MRPARPSPASPSTTNSDQERNLPAVTRNPAATRNRAVTRNGNYRTGKLPDRELTAPEESTSSRPQRRTASPSVAQRREPLAFCSYGCFVCHPRRGSASVVVCSCRHPERSDGSRYPPHPPYRQHLSPGLPAVFRNSDRDNLPDRVVSELPTIRPTTTIWPFSSSGMVLRAALTT
jgi:hypothetical protein